MLLGFKKEADGEAKGVPKLFVEKVSGKTCAPAVATFKAANQQPLKSDQWQCCGRLLEGLKVHG